MSQPSETSPKGEYCACFEIVCPHKGKFPGSCAKIPVEQCEKMAKEAKDGSKEY